MTGLPVTISDRFTAAWKAFRQNTKPDPDAFKKWKAARLAEQRASIDKLEPYDRALVDSVAGNTTNAEQLFTQLLPAIEALPFEDQFRIMQFVTKPNPAAVIYPAMRGWTTRNGAALADATR